MKLKTADLWALAPFTVMMLIFLWPLFLLQKGFLLYDYSLQHAPWAAYLAQCLKKGALPFWTQQMTCGFPLAAEGQIGAFYPVQWALYVLLPFRAAYNGNVLIHFFLAGMGFYLYVRKWGLSRPAAGFSVLPFVFGSGYAGCFYNTASLKVLAWLPWALFILAPAKEAGRRSVFFRLIALAMVFSMQWTAGFSQMAVYAFGYCVVHQAVCVDWKGKHGWGRRLGPVFFVLAAIFLGTCLSLPQVLSSVELIGQSVRQGETAAFALWGSVPPAAPVSLFFPEWGNWLRLSFYIGIGPLLFVLILFLFPSSKHARVHWILAGLFFLAALGRHNPVYSWAVEHFSLTFLRNPSKFLFFTATSLSVLAGIGFDRMLAATGKQSKPLIRLAVLFGVAVALLPFLADRVRISAAPFWNTYAQSYVEKLMAAKGSAAKPAEYYQAVMGSFFEGLGRLFSYRNPFNGHALLCAWIAAAVFLGHVFGKIRKQFFISAIFVLTCADLCFFAITIGTGFLGNIGNFESWEHSSQRAQALAARTEPADGIVEYVRDLSHEIVPPNTNLTDGIVHRGGYTPLLLKRYHELTRDLGIVDNSLGRAVFSENVWVRERGVLDLVGGTLLHADVPLDWKGLESIEKKKDYFLYRNLQALPDAMAYSDWKILGADEALAFMKSAAFDPKTTLVLEKNPPDGAPEPGGPVAAQILARTEGGLTARVDTPRNAVVWLRLAAYPGWRVFIDGAETSWFFAQHAFIGVAVPRGIHEVRAVYAPRWLPGLLIFNGFAWVAAFIVLLGTGRRTSKKYGALR